MKGSPFCLFLVFWQRIKCDGLARLLTRTGCYYVTTLPASQPEANTYSLNNMEKNGLMKTVHQSFAASEKIISHHLGPPIPSLPGGGGGGGDPSWEKCNDAR